MTEKLRTCTRCGTSTVSWCPVCSSEFESRRPASEMSAEERVREYRSWGVCEIEFSKIHRRIEELVGRSVYTHELAFPDALVAEIERGVSADLPEILNKLPAGKLVVIDAGEGDIQS